MAERRRHSTIITELAYENDRRNLKFQNDTPESDFIKRRDTASVRGLRGYRYRLDGHYRKRSTDKQPDDAAERAENANSLFRNDTKTVEIRQGCSSANSSPQTVHRSDLITDQHTTSTLSKGPIYPQKPRTVKQQKNKKRQKELEKEFSKNERWKCLSDVSTQKSECRQVTIIPLSYDERAVDCEGLDESLAESRYRGFNSFQSASSMLSISTPFDTPIFQKTKPKRSRFRTLSSIFGRKSSSREDINATISELDLARWYTFNQCTAHDQPKGGDLHKAKSTVDLSNMASSSKNVNRVTLLGRATDPKEHKFSTSTDEFRKTFVEGLWTAHSPESARPPSPVLKDPTPTLESESACKSVDSGYESPEIAQKVSSADENAVEQQVRKASSEKPEHAYERFDLRKAGLFNEYFSSQEKQSEADDKDLVYCQNQTAQDSTIALSCADEAVTDKCSDKESLENHDDKKSIYHTELPKASRVPALPPRSSSMRPRGAEEDEGGDVLPKMAQSEAKDDKSSMGHQWPVVVAIDFGTSSSGYAYAFRDKSDDHVYMMRRPNANDMGVSSSKYPTCILLEPDGRFHSFGWDARESYHDLEPQLARRYLYFESFKAALGCEKGLKRQTKIAAVNGTLWPAIDVLAHCLRYLKRHALIELSEFTGSMVNPAHMQWVVTVPAMWRQPAKQLMRLAAYQAGLASPERFHQLIIALEPEAASIYCTKLKQHQVLPSSTSLKSFFSLPSSLRMSEINRRPYRTDFQAAQLELGSAYLVVDCGGGKADVTVHRLTKDGEIVQIHKASGGPHGSTETDRAFESLLCDIFSADFVSHFRSRYPAAYVDLMLSFESRKRAAHPYKSNPFNVALPFSFLEFYKKTFGHRVDCAVKRYEKKQHVTWNEQGMLRLSAEMMSSLFMPTVVAILKLIADALEAVQPADVSCLCLVGGFAESPLLQHEIRNAFENRMKIIIPNEASTAVLRGAVLYGLHPQKISARRSRSTYGISVLHPFDPLRHPVEKRVSKNGRDWCKDVFEKFVTTNESISFDQEMVRHYCPASTDQTQIQIQIYCTESLDPRFVTDPGVERCGVLKIDLPKAAHNDGKEGIRDREIKASVKFGGTELVLQAVDVFSGEPVNGCIDFLR